MVKETFIIYSSFYKPISLLSDKQLGRLFRAIFKYNLGEVVGVEDDIRMAFEFFKNQFEIDKSKYQAKVAKNSENGRKGGNPNFKKGQTNPYNKADGGVITEDNRTLPKITLNDNENVNENEKEKEQKRDTDVSPESPDPINPDSPKKETHPPVAQPPLPDPDFLKFQKWILEKAPQVAKLKEPFTEEEYLRIKEEFPPGMTAEVLLAMHNCKDLLKKYVSANLTFRNWINRRLKDGKNIGSKVHEVVTDPATGDFSDDI